MWTQIFAILDPIGSKSKSIGRPTCYTSTTQHCKVHSCRYAYDERRLPAELLVEFSKVYFATMIKKKKRRAMPFTTTPARTATEQQSVDKVTSLSMQIRAVKFTKFS